MLLQTASDPLWTPRQGQAPEEIADLVDAYGGKSVPRGYRGYTDEKPGEALATEDFAEMMAAYNEHERMERGRTHVMAGTERARPDAQADPLASAR